MAKCVIRSPQKPARKHDSGVENRFDLKRETREVTEWTYIPCGCGVHPFGALQPVAVAETAGGFLSVDSGLNDGRG